MRMINTHWNPNGILSFFLSARKNLKNFFFHYHHSLANGFYNTEFYVFICRKVKNIVRERKRIAKLWKSNQQMLKGKVKQIDFTISIMGWKEMTNESFLVPYSKFSSFWFWFGCQFFFYYFCFILFSNGYSIQINDQMMIGWIAFVFAIDSVFLFCFFEMFFLKI